MVFVGHEFEHDPTMSRVKDLLLGASPVMAGYTRTRVPSCL